jgi:hypothetical protein
MGCDPSWVPNQPEPVTGDVARRWTLARMPVWPPWLVVAVAVVGVIVSIATDQTVCTPKDPSVCGPDVAFALAAPMLVTGLVTLWVWPVAASLLVFGYVGLDLVYDPALPARYAFAALGLVVLGYAAAHVALRAHQRATLAGLAGPAHRPVAYSRSWPKPVAMLVGAAGAGLVCGVSGFWYAHQVDATASHVASSVVVDSVAGSVDSEGNQTFALSSPPSGTPSTVSILPALDTYPEGSHQPVRVDLADRGWVRLVAEPDDHTDWLSLSVGTGILALLMLSHARGRAMNRRRLADGDWPGVGVTVRVIGAEVWVSAADASHTTLATFATSEGQGDLRSRPGVLVGDLRAQGWAAVWTDHSILLPVTRLSVQGGPEAMTDAAAESLLRSYEEDGGNEWDGVDSVPPLAEHRASGSDVRRPSLGARVKNKVFGREGARRIDAANNTARRWSESSPVVFLYRLGGLVLGVGIIWFSGSMLGPAWAAAHGEGVPGAVTVQDISCGKSGCDHYGTFRSDDGAYEFTDVNLVNGEAAVGQQARALYEGQGEDPDEVYGPGWGGFVENGLYVGLGMSFLLFGLGGLLEPIMLRRRPGGRHARPL